MGHRTQWRQGRKGLLKDTSFLSRINGIFFWDLVIFLRIFCSREGICLFSFGSLEFSFRTLASLLMIYLNKRRSSCSQMAGFSAPDQTPGAMTYVMKERR